MDSFDQRLAKKDDTLIPPHDGTGLTVPDFISVNKDGSSDVSRRTRSRSRTLSQVPFPFRPSAVEGTTQDISRLVNVSDNPAKSDKARQETRKLLSHILNELRNRPRPPPAWMGHTLALGSRSLEKSGRQKETSKPSTSGNSTVRSRLIISSDSDSDDDTSSSFSPGITFNLLNRLRDVLILAKLKDWRLFEDGADSSNPLDSDTKQSSFRFRRSSFAPNGRRSRSFSPGRQKKSHSGLLSRCLNLLQSIVMEDCRYQFHSLKLDRPPNALQALTLNVAQILAFVYREDSRILYELSLAVTPAFCSFPASMHGLLVTFFEGSILRSMMQVFNKSLKSSDALPSNKTPTDDVIQGSEDLPIVAIQVDEANDETSSPFQTYDWQRWTPPGQPSLLLPSSFAPCRTLEHYYACSAISPLLAVLLETADLTSEDLILRYRLHTFITLLVDSKLDLPLNLLEIIAYHSPRARAGAIAVLLTFWPRACGHLCIGKPFPRIQYCEDIRAYGTRQLTSQHPHSHQFVPWLFKSCSQHSEANVTDDCHSCSKQISEFGLMCPLCLCIVHMNCYDSPDGAHLSHYPVSSGSHTRRVAVHRFSYLKPGRNDPGVAQRGQHLFRPVNIFTLSICSVCQLPLWGYFAQGYRCGSCNHYVHCACLDRDAAVLPRCNADADVQCISVGWRDFLNSFEKHYKEILLTEEEIQRCSHEEVSIYWSVLSVQLHLLKCGVASGAIEVIQDQSIDNLDNFQLHRVLNLYQAYLNGNQPGIRESMQSGSLDDHHMPHQKNLLFDWSMLSYITSCLKSPQTLDENGQGLLNVLPPDGDGAHEGSVTYTSEMISLAQLRDRLGSQFGLRRAESACIMIRHLQHLGFFDCSVLPDSNVELHQRSSEIPCRYVLPLSLDLSSDVELLIAAIEACLDDMDIAVNETGFLLLMRRFWPSDMMSDYAFSRLVMSVIKWVLVEDDNLVVILRQYIGKQQDPPGVPSVTDSRIWPSYLPSRPSSTGSFTSGSDYLTCRKTILHKYATRWLFAFHECNSELYSSFLFDTLDEIARDSERLDILDIGREKDKFTVTSKENMLRYILKLCQASVAFSASDNLLRAWLDIMSDEVESQSEPLSQLPRLFNREADGSNRWTIVPDATITSFELSGEYSLRDPWKVVIGIASVSSSNLRKALRWLCIFASSGVDIPVYVFQQFSDLTNSFRSPFIDLVALGESIFKATWIKSIGRQELHVLISGLHNRCADHIVNIGQEATDNNDISRFTRFTLSTLLLLHGCERARLQELELVLASDVEGLVSRRKVTRTASVSNHPMTDDSTFVEHMARYAETRNERLRSLIAKYLATFVTETSYLSSEEIDAFIKRNGPRLMRIAWKLYDMHAAEINNLRVVFLIRLLSVDVKVLMNLLQGEDEKGTALMLRYDSVSRLFQIILDSNRPAFRTIDPQQFRASIMPIFYKFFGCMWCSRLEEVRIAIQAWAQTLQPAHQKSLASFFNEALLHSSLSDRLELVSFLLQLRSHFPTWKVLSWEAVIETLMDDDFMQRNNAEEGAISAHLSMYGIPSASSVGATEPQDSEAGILQSSLILLSLQMIADGVPIDLFSLLKIKLQMAMLLGFASATLVPAANGQSFYVQFGELFRPASTALPCLSGLMALLDSRRPFQLPTSAMTVTGPEDDSVTQALVGSPFLDLFLHTFIRAGETVTAFPNSRFKILLQSITVALYKHDIECPPLRHLRDLLRRAVKLLSDILPENVGHELKQLALTGILAFRIRWPSLSSSRDFLNHIVTNVIKFLSAHELFSDDVTHGQGVSLLEDIFSRHSAIFYNLSRRRLDQETFSILRLALTKSTRKADLPIPLAEIVFKDTLQALANFNTLNSGEQKVVFENIRQYVDNVHKQGYLSETLSLTGECFVAVLRNASESTDSGFDTSSLFVAAATLIQYNKANIRGFLQYVESALRIALMRFDINKEALHRLFQTTFALYRRLAPDPTTQGIERNGVLAATTEILSDYLRGKCRMAAVTVEAVIDCVCSENPAFFSSEIVNRLASDAFFYIQSWGPTSDFYQHHSLQTSRAACFLVLHVTHNDIGFLSRQMNDYEQKNGKHALAVRIWNILALEALRKPSLEGVAIQVFAHLPNFSMAYHTSLRGHIQTFGLSSDLFVFDINQAYIAIKLWLLLSSHCAGQRFSDDGLSVSTERQSSEDRNASLVWNELWPAFENLISLSDQDADVSDVTPISSLIWSSIADLLLFLRISRNSMSLESSTHMAVLNRLRDLGRGDSHARKLIRTANSITDIPPQTPSDALITQIEQELRAAEKLLQALALGIGKSIPERSRRDLRIPTG